jgi:hypothetical protein
VLKRYHIGREHFQCNTDFTQLVMDVSCTMLDTLASCYQGISKPELLGRVRKSLDELEAGSSSSSVEATTILNRYFEFTGNINHFVTLARLRELEIPLSMKRLQIKRWLLQLGGVEQNQCYLDGVPQGRAITRVQELPAL